MADDNDQVLLRAYVRDRCEAAFSELVHRHVDLVHSTALRIVRDPSLAEEVTQRVFLALAKHSVKLQDRTSITGWLHETTRNLAINTVRSEERRRQRESRCIGTIMNHPDANNSEARWEQLAPCLDEALSHLNATERDVLLWRYFERCTAEQIGGRLGLRSEAAQKRVARALDRLRGILAERGVSAPTANLAALLSTQAVQSAPAGLAAAAITATSAASAAFPVTSTLQILMASTKAKISLAALLAASVTTPLVLQYQANGRLREQIALLRAEPAAPQAQSPAVSSETAEAGRLRDEFLRLRDQVTQLRQQLANQPKASSNPALAGSKPVNNRLAEEMDNATRLLSKSPDIPMIHSNDFRNAGYSTAAASFHTLNWAAANRDTNAFLKAAGLEPDARQRADELFAQMPEAIRQRYGSVDALLVDWAMNKAEPPEAYRILSQRDDGPDAASLTVQFQYANSRVRENEASFFRDQDGNWRRAIPAGVVEKLPNVVNSQAQATAAGH